MLRGRWIVALLLFAAASSCFSLSVGSVSIPLAQLLSLLLHHAHDPIRETILWQLRLPRMLTAFTTGGLLALAGVLMQILTRNPLADPYILGVSGGAACGALTAILLGFTLATLHLFAFSGACFAALIVFLLARDGERWSNLRLLLIGVIVGAGFSAIISLLLALNPSGDDLHSMLFWLMGDLSGSTTIPYGAMVLLFLAGFYSLTRARALNALTLGELQARNLGVHTRRLFWQLYFLSAIVTADAVMLAGCIGFVGLIVPHLMRRLHGSDHRLLLPTAVLFGGSLLVLADALSRWLFAPVQLPVGVMMAFIGVPLFIVVLRKKG